MSRGMSDKNLIVSIGKAVLNAAKGLGQILVVYDSPVCYQCKKPVHPDFDFCSEACTFEYWKKCRDQYQKLSGQKVCGYPGCSKPCYRERGRTYDYCSKSHAMEHKTLQDWGQGRRLQQHQPGGSHQGKHHHGNSHHNHHQNTRTQSDHSSSRWPWSTKPATGPIKFYNRDDPYYEFTNFYSAPIEIDRKTWPTTEHYFQAQKFVGTPYEEQIRHFPRPRQAFDFTRDPKVSRWRRNDWESIKEHVMYKALLAKFTQHDDLRKLLLRTGERKLVEHSPYDSYWGDGGDGAGKNRLGELLMQLRHELQSGQKGKKSASVFPHIQQEVTRESLQHSSQSGQSEEQSGGTPPTSAYGDLPRRPLQKQPSYPADPAMDHQPSYTGDNTDRGLPAQHDPHVNQPTSAENTMQQSSNGSQQPSHHQSSNISGTMSNGSQPKVDQFSYESVPSQLPLSAPINNKQNQTAHQRDSEENMDWSPPLP